MPHDLNGTVLQVGDKVNLPCIVKSIDGVSEKECNVTIEAVEPAGAEGYYKPAIALNSKSVVKVVAMLVMACLLQFLGGCSSITPAQQAQITAAEKTIAQAAQIAAPLAGNKAISNDLYALSAVAAAYGNAPVPTNIVQATALVPQTAAVVLPLINGNNSPRTQALINGAAALLANPGNP